MKYRFSEKGMTEEELLQFSKEPQVNPLIRFFRKVTSWGEIYGAGEEIRRRGRYPRFLPLFISADHGPTQFDYILDEYLESSKPMFTFSKRLWKEWYKSSKKPCYVLTSPFVTYRRKENINKAPDAKGTLVFFGHSLPDIDNEIDISSYIKQLKEDLPEKFRPASVCLHFVDVQKGFYKPFLEEGIPVYTAGHWHNKDFPYNFYNIIQKFSYTVSNHCGSYAFYSVEMGIPFSFWGEKPKFINISHPTVVLAEEDMKEMKQVVKGNLLFKGLQEKITPEQKKFVEDELGIYDGIGDFKLSCVLYLSLLKWIFVTTPKKIYNSICINYKQLYKGLKLRDTSYEEVFENSIKTLLLIGRMNSESVKNKPIKTELKDVEFSVFSKWGEDGVIQYLINNVDIKNKTFVELGVGNYAESNTKFLLMYDNWQGFVTTASKKNADLIQCDDIYWKYDLQVKVVPVTRGNVNGSLMKIGFDPDIGMLSISIWGNEYWVWESIRSRFKPRIVVVRYNSVFGLRPVTIPYRDTFNRTRAHYSNLYYGASLTALCYLAQKKNYFFVGANKAACSAFFIRKDLANNFNEVVPTEEHVFCKLKESTDVDGNLSFLRGKERFDLIKDMPVVNVETSERIKLSDC